MNASLCLSRLNLSGVPLEGDNIVRMVFLDEAGTGNPKHEPFLAVGGIIVNADKQWKAVERRLAELRRRFMPPEAPTNYAFHASELYSGGKYFRRDLYSRSERWHILETLVGIPAEFNLPVVDAYFERANAPDDAPELPFSYTRCFASVMSSVEAYMRVLPANEVAMVILEDNHEIRAHIKQMQRTLQDGDALLGSAADWRDRHWLTNVVGEPHFEGKGAASLLQIADAVAFAIKRAAMQAPNYERFVEPLASCFVWHHKPRTDHDEQGQSF